MNTAHRIAVVFALPAVLVLAAQGPSPPPRDDLLRLVPDDVAFCVVVQDLREHWAAISASPFAGQFRQSPVSKAVADAPELAKLANLGNFFKKHFEVDWPDIRDELLGDCVVFAYRPGPPGKPEQEQGMFLVRARSAALLAKMVDRLNQLQLQSGELKKLEQRQHNGVVYHCRVEANQPPGFYYLRGPILVFSQQEPILQQAIDLDRGARPADAVTPPISRQIRQLAADRSLAAVWINPRAFDAELQQRLATSPAGEAHFLRSYVRHWQALDGVVLSLVPGKDLEVNLTARVRPDELSSAARRLLAEAARASELWPAFPPDAIVAGAIRIDSGALSELLSEFLDEETRKNLIASLEQRTGPNVARTLREVVLHLGPDAGLYLAAPRPGDPGWMPEAVAAVRVRPRPGGKSTEQAVLDALDFFASRLVLEHNSQHDDRLSLESMQQGPIRVKYLANVQRFPRGFRPAYSVKDSYLVFASSPESIGRFQGKTAMPGNDPESPLLRWAVPPLRSYLEERREGFIGLIADRNQVPRQEAAAQLDRLVSVLQLIDGVELTQRPTPGQVTLTLRVRPTRPLR
jgi:hypothetical protein